MPIEDEAAYGQSDDSIYSFLISPSIPYSALKVSRSDGFLICRISSNLPVFISRNPVTCSPLQMLALITGSCVSWSYVFAFDYLDLKNSIPMPLPAFPFFSHGAVTYMVLLNHTEDLSYICSLRGYILQYFIIFAGESDDIDYRRYFIGLIDASMEYSLAPSS